jgi:hypothetical protein
LPIQSRVSAGAFDPETMRILTAAFEDAWQSLNGDGIGLGPHTDAMRDALAKSIIEVATDGERDARLARCRLGASGAVAPSRRLVSPLSPSSG